MKAKEIIGEITDNKSINVKLVEEDSVVMPEVFISTKANELAKEVADEIVNALDKRIYKDVAVKTRLDEYGRNFYRELDKDIDVLVMLQKSSKDNKSKIEKVVDEKIEDTPDEDLVEATKKVAEVIPVTEKEEAQAGRDSKKITVDNTVVDTGNPTSNTATPDTITTNANNNVNVNKTATRNTGRG